MASEDILRIIASSTLAVGTAGAAVASTAKFGTQTYAIDVVFTTVPIATSGLRFNIGEFGSGAITVSSTSSPLLPANWVARYKVTPGQVLAALSNDASAIAGLSIVELSK